MTTLLASMEDFAVFRGVTFDPTDLQALISLEAASGVVRVYTAQDFDYVTDDEILLDGHGTRGLLLPQLPVQEVTEVALVDWDGTETALTSDEWVLDDGGILYRGPDTGLSPAWSFPWWAGAKNVRIVYSHGYILPGEAEITDVPALPSELSLVTMQIASRNLTQGTSGGQTVKAKSLGSYSVTYATDTLIVDERGISASERLVLDKYRVRSAI